MQKNLDGSLFGILGSNLNVAKIEFPMWFDFANIMHFFKVELFQLPMHQFKYRLSFLACLQMIKMHSSMKTT